jgi:NAD(P)-dependent dehydrogenase (short-subunit alcohol dehydrogenase family)
MRGSPKTVVITGGTSGIGRQAVLDFARSGAVVYAVGRSAERCAAVERQLCSEVPGAPIKFLTADLSQQAQVRRLADQLKYELRASGRPLDGLVNNAGLYASRRTNTVDGIELTFAVNHLAPFLLTQLLLPLLTQSTAGRVITLSSYAHYTTLLDVQRVASPPFYLGLWAYKSSKLANVLFSMELDRRFQGSSARAFALDPGLVNTGIAGKGTDPLTRLIWYFKRRQGTPPSVPVQTLLHLVYSPQIQENPAVYWRDLHPKKPDRQALRVDLALSLWRRSCELCALPLE